MAHVSTQPADTMERYQGDTMRQGTRITVLASSPDGSALHMLRTLPEQECTCSLRSVGG